jgi:hypothetical protein
MNVEKQTKKETSMKQAASRAHLAACFMLFSCLAFIG